MTDQTAEQLAATWVRPEIRAISAYHVPDPAGLIKLDAMENPYNWPEAIRADWLDALGAAQLNRYPHPEAPALKERLREVLEIPADAGLLLGNGSDELIQMLALTLGGPGRCILSVEPGFVMYRMIATFAGMDYRGVPLNAEGFSLELGPLLQAIEEQDPALIFLAYPNNPTGNLFSAADLERVMRAARGVVVVDEAYAPFTDETFLQRLGEFPNLLVLRTLSKMGFAGLRLGLLAGPQAWTREIDKTRLPYNINVLTQISTEFALRHKAVFDDQTAEIRRSRQDLLKALNAMDGILAYESQANFILFRTPAGQAPAIHAGLKEQGVLIKNLHGTHPLLADCLRVTVGAPEENRAFLAGLRASCG